MKDYHFMLPQSGAKEVLVKQNYIFEPCFDGTRVLVYKDENGIMLRNKKGKNISYKYPEFRQFAGRINADSAVLDAMIVVMDKDGKPSIDLLQKRELLDNGKDILAESDLNPATLFIIDALELFESDFTSVALNKRKEKLKEIIKENQNFRVIPYIGNGREVWTKMQEIGVEGVIAKDIHSIYEGGKSWNWIKVNNTRKADCFVIGKVQDMNFEENPSIILLLGAFENRKVRYAGSTEVKIGPGKKIDDEFSEKFFERLMKEGLKKGELPPISIEELKRIRKIYSGKQIKWLRPELVAEVKYFGFNDFSELKAPVFLRLRDDKWSDECVLEKKEF